jgi:hypothetical protein
MAEGSRFASLEDDILKIIDDNFFFKCTHMKNVLVLKSINRVD